MNVRDRQAENTKNAILKVAAEMFLSQGYQATSTRKIAQELNITQPNMYHYYKNKKVLYIKAIEYAVDGFSENLLDEYNQQKNLPFEELLNYMAKYMIENFRINYFIMRNDIENFFTPEEKKILVKIGMAVTTKCYSIFFNRTKMNYELIWPSRYKLEPF